MKKPRIQLALCLLLAALLLGGCSRTPVPAATEPPAPAETPSPAPEPSPAAPEPAPAAPGEDFFPFDQAEPPIRIPDYYIGVNSVDTLLGAIAPGTAVVLAPGVYDLSTAADYGVDGQSQYYHWEESMDGYALVLENMDGLQLLAPEGAEILAAPRYAAVLSLYNCQNTTLAGLTMGHSVAPGSCAGGVLDLTACSAVEIRSCFLYGCGVQGVYAAYCEDLTVSYTRIYDCSLWASTLRGCTGVLFEDCWIHDCGKSEGGDGYQLFSVNGCRYVAFLNTRVSDNNMYSLLSAGDSRGVSLLGCTVENNRFTGPVFQFEGEGALVADCSFSHRGPARYYDVNEATLFARGRNGEDLLSFDLDRMQRQRADYEAPADGERPAWESGAPLEQQLEDGTRQIRVSTVDQLLNAIGPDTVILLEPGVYDLSTAATYGGIGGEWYSWDQRFDGPSLLIRGVWNLRIEGAGRGLTELLVRPRYASVFTFEECKNVSLFGFTAGHTEEDAYCVGNVLDFKACSNMAVEDCGLFGCGVIGVNAENSRGISLRNTEIYSCSDMAACFYGCKSCEMENCSIYGCLDGRNYVLVSGSWLSVDGESLADGLYVFDHRTLLGPLSAD